MHPSSLSASILLQISSGPLFPFYKLSSLLHGFFLFCQGPHDSPSSLLQGFLPSSRLSFLAKAILTGILPFCRLNSQHPAETGRPRISFPEIVCSQAAFQQQYDDKTTLGICGFMLTLKRVSSTWHAAPTKNPCTGQSLSTQSSREHTFAVLAAALSRNPSCLSPACASSSSPFSPSFPFSPSSPFSFFSLSLPATVSQVN